MGPTLARRKPIPQDRLMAKNHKPPWSRDELILALRLYQSSGALRRSEPEVIQLSGRLNTLSSDQDSLDQFRSPAAVALKLANFQALDPAVPTGMERGGRDTAIVWEEMGHDPARVATLAAAIEAA